jgi:hypothetical protein
MSSFVFNSYNTWVHKRCTIFQQEHISVKYVTAIHKKVNISFTVLLYKIKGTLFNVGLTFMMKKKRITII